MSNLQSFGDYANGVIRRIEDVFENAAEIISWREQL